MASHYAQLLNVLHCHGDRFPRSHFIYLPSGSPFFAVLLPNCVQLIPFHSSAMLNLTSFR